jgi:hypothetical protein
LQRRIYEAAAAAAEGVRLAITSGWRSTTDQDQLIAEAVATYGSAAEAHRRLLPPDKSAHVKGEAIDVGPTSGAPWLGEHGAVQPPPHLRQRRLALRAGDRAGRRLPGVVAGRVGGLVTALRAGQDPVGTRASRCSAQCRASHSI